MTNESGDTQHPDMNAVVDMLMHQSNTVLSHDEVENIFNEEYSRLEKEARIKGYLQLLSYRSTMDRLRVTDPTIG